VAPDGRAIMRAQFISEPIEVEQSDLPSKPPVSLRWRDEDYPVEHVEATWHDASWGPLRTRVKRWWQRRHRTYYQLRVAGGRIFEVYNDRGLGRWVLYRILHLEPEG
jgi:hypothetical protein